MSTEQHDPLATVLADMQEIRHLAAKSKTTIFTELGGTAHGEAMTIERIADILVGRILEEAGVTQLMEGPDA